MTITCKDYQFFSTDIKFLNPKDLIEMVDLLGIHSVGKLRISLFPNMCCNINLVWPFKGCRLQEKIFLPVLVILIFVHGINTIENVCSIETER